jgi:hypothetical protein
MTEEIINRVSQSKLITLDLEDYYPEGIRLHLDIKDWLHEGMVLREKEFRNHVDQHPWINYKGAFVAIFCSTDAIVPAWAYMLISTRLQPFARQVVTGSLQDLETSLYQSILDRIDFSQFDGKSVIIKGCSRKPVPLGAYLRAAFELRKVAGSIMYGEACSSVPIFKLK